MSAVWFTTLPQPTLNICLGLQWKCSATLLLLERFPYHFPSPFALEDLNPPSRSSEMLYKLFLLAEPSVFPLFFSTHNTSNWEHTMELWEGESGPGDLISGLLLLGHVLMQMYVYDVLGFMPHLLSLRFQANHHSQIYAEFSNIVSMKFFDKCCQLSESLTGNGFSGKHGKWERGWEQWAHISIPFGFGLRMVLVCHGDLALNAPHLF